MTIIVAGTITIDPSKIDVAVAAMTSMMEETHKEEGNVAYVFAKDMTNPAIIHVYEKWESQEVLEIHMKSPHMASFMGSMGEFGVTEAAIRKHEVSGESDLF